MKPSNLKDQVTGICMFLIVISGAFITLEKTGVLPYPIISTIGVSVSTLATALVAYFTGKNPDGSTKSDQQVTQQNIQSK